MTVETYLLFFKIQSYLSVLIILLSFIYFGKRQLEVRLIGLAYIVMIAGDLCMYVLPLHGKDVNIPTTISNILTPIIFCYMFYVAWNKKYGVMVLSITVLFATFSIYNYLFIQKTDINSFTTIASAIPLILFCVIYFYRLLVDLPAHHLHQLPMFWFSTAILIFNAGTLFLSVFTHYLVEVLQNDFLLYGSFMIIMNIIQQLVVMIGLWQDLRNIKSPSSSLSAL